MTTKRDLQIKKPKDPASIGTEWRHPPKGRQIEQDYLHTVPTPCLSPESNTKMASAASSSKSLSADPEIVAKKERKRKRREAREVVVEEVAEEAVEEVETTKDAEDTDETQKRSPSSRTPNAGGRRRRRSLQRASRRTPTQKAPR